MKITLIPTAFAIVVLSLSPALADTQRGSSDGHSMTTQEQRGSASGGEQRGSTSSVTEAEGEGVINTVDSEGGTVNVTHAPIAALNWPKMTMDLPVTRRVDLGQVKPGAKVSFKVKQGRDKQYRIIEITPAE